MKRKSAKKSPSRKKTKKKESSWLLKFIGISAVVIVVLVVKDVSSKTGVLGRSTLLAQIPDAGGVPQGGSEPQQQQQNNQPQPQQDSGQQQPQQPQQQFQSQQQQNYQPQQFQQSQQQQWQPKTQEEQKQYQQFQQQSPEQQRQIQQKYQQQGEQQRSQEFQQRNQQQENQKQFQQQGQPFGQSGSSGNFPGPKPPTQEEFQQFQQEFQQQAEKNGIQFSGTLPQQFQQFQIQQNGQGNNQFQPLPSLKDFPAITGRFEVQSANRGQNINLNDGNTKIFLGNNVFKAKNADGTEVELHSDELEKINNAIELETGSKIEQSGKNFVMRRGGIEAQTNFPIGFNVATKTFTVTTPSGEKELNFLPDQAMQKLLENKIISKIAPPPQQGTEEGDKGIKLTEFNDKPVFEVRGVSDKRFLGFFPVSIQKTALVSAETGDVVSTDQNVFSRFLETISF